MRITFDLGVRIGEPEKFIPRSHKYRTAKRRLPPESRRLSCDLMVGHPAYWQDKHSS
jgi:hypothetical protein